MTVAHIGGWTSGTWKLLSILLALFLEGIAWAARSM